MLSNVEKALVAGAPPLLLYVGTATGYAHWFDSGEFVAAAADFGISHPPGQPLASLLLGVANLLPFGSIAFRTALICALCGAISVVALTFAFERTLGAGDVIRRPLRFGCALAAAWWVAGTHAWWFQAIRPEVYALQAALCCIAIERLICASFAERGGDVRPLYQAALALGLALANHHFIAALGLIPSLWLLPSVWRRFGWRPVAWSCAFAGAGLMTYLYLPLRSASEPFLNLGDPSTPSRFWWVVTAQAFQKSLAPTTVAPFGERFADVLLVTGQDLHVAVCIVALLGLYFMLRIKGSRRYALFWLTLWLVYVGGRASIGFVRGNPDAIAYFMLSYASVAVLTAFAIGVLLSALAEALPSNPRLAPSLAALLAIGATLQVPRSWHDTSLASFSDTDTFDDGLRRALPPRSVVLVHNPQTIFRFWGGEAEEGNRPDITMIPVPILSYPKLVDRFVRNEPELAPLLRSYLLEGRLSVAELQSLAAKRPVFVEMDVRVEPEMFDLIVPEQLYHRVLTADTTTLDEVAATEAHAVLWSDLYARVEHPIEPHTKTQLLWRHYLDSIYFAGVGETEAARRTIDAGLALNPHAKELNLLLEAVDRSTRGERIDVEPFRIH